MAEARHTTTARRAADLYVMRVGLELKMMGVPAAAASAVMQASICWPSTSDPLTSCLQPLSPPPTLDHFK